MRLAALMLFPTLALAGAKTEFPGDAELLWPDDPRARAFLQLEARASGIRPSSGWPRTVGEVCAPARDSAFAGLSVLGPELASLRTACIERDAPPPIVVTANLGAYALGKTVPLGPTFERFSASGWRSVRTDAELAQAWTALPPLVGLEFNHAFSPRLSARFRMGLRRDMVAWRADDLSWNVPLGASEVDINEPSHGWLRYEGPALSATVGRFPIQWSPSPEFGLTLSSSVAYHDGAEFAWRLPRLTYRFLVSSLNPWLEGTPPPGGSSEDYPVGSEEWRQRNYPDIGAANNGHRRVYDARIKTLLAHRLETWVGPLTLGLTEAQVVGGKVPDLRDLNPFTVFHNEFREGYTNTNVSIDALARLPGGFFLGGEFFMDDLTWEDTESGSGKPGLFGRMLFLRQGMRKGGWSLSQSLHAIWTDPFLYGYLQPLNTYTSRRILTTNHPSQSDSLFYDKVVIDQPLGYIRGGDALDFRYALRGSRGRYSGTFAAALLSRGEVGASTPYELSYAPHGSSPSGIAEEETRLLAEGGASLPRGATLSLALGWSRYRNLGHEEGRRAAAFRAAMGVSWTYPHRVTSR